MYSSFVGGIDIKYGKINELKHKSNAIDGDDVNTVWVHMGAHSVGNFVWASVNQYYILILDPD